jgi:peptidyl-prolyl cis-trans isomerase D
MVRDRLTTYLVENAGSRLDSIYMDSLALQNQIKVVKGAAPAMRAAGENPEKARGSNKKLATFKGGELTVGEFIRWIRALPPQYAAQLKEADDTMLTKFAKVLSQNVLLLRQADSAKIQVTPEEWKGIAANYRAQVDTLRMEMGLDTALSDSTASKAQRNKVAGEKVEQYFERLVSGKSRLRTLPSALGTLLRERSSYRIYDSGLNRAVELAQAERSKSDSAKAKAGQLQPAPGPAPIPGMSPAPGGQAPQATPRPRAAPGDSQTTKLKR